MTSRIPDTVTRLIVSFSLLLLSWSAQALTLDPFKADYEVYRGDSRVGMAEFLLSHQNGIWYWEMNTQLTGFYKYLTRKRPFTHTQMQIVEDQPKLLVELSGDYPDQPAEHTAWFDFDHQTLYSMKNNTIKRDQLPDVIYNYHSVHLVYPQMLNMQKLERTIAFYRKGRIEESTLELDKGISIDQDGKKIIIDRVTQSFHRSKKKMVYDYIPGEMAPYRIQQLKPGKEATLMIRQN